MKRLSLIVIVWVVAFLVGLVPQGNASAHYPYRPSTPWYGARAIEVNWYNGWTRNGANTRWITVIDWYCGFLCNGVPSAIKNSSYYPSQAWNQSDNPHTWVVKDVAGETDDTLIFILAHDGHSPTATHIHLYVLYGGSEVEDNGLSLGPAVRGNMHVRQSTLDSGTNSAATVISHEVGHAMGLADEDGSHTSLMKSPNPGVIMPTSGDRRTPEWCIPYYFYFPC